MIDTRVAAESKSSGTAFLLWFFLGVFGAHRFYLGRPGTALLMILAWVLFIVPGFVWWVVDAFLISGMIKTDNNRLRARLQSDFSMMNSARQPSAQSA
ncbi:TM2 domain-containing protein [Maricaulis maris]|uniref:TM2 domain-containing membrane protein YozV n=1 Tax=Maricaulis maris TaxID=74318 RepID=A0A495DL00_9PROT|nr:TM2 domain-containing membrane protein YozV [Maricaulis maris]